ncbi:MAG: LysR family transcriptional regulator [Acutalibacter sp.]|jgi:DNA-binding transcriptional LysR family regulator
MELRQIHYFLEVVERSCFTKAAEACFISQSAISQQIKASEEEVGVPLLVRQGRSSPSPWRKSVAGEALLGGSHHSP